MGGFLEEEDDPIDNTLVSSGDRVDLSTIQAMSQRATPKNYSLPVTLAGDAAFGVLDLADTVSSSIPFVSRSLGIDRGDLNQTALNALDMPGLRDFYNDNRGGIEAMSGLAGIVASELIARKLTAPASVFMAAASKLPYVRRLATLDAEYANAMNVVRKVDSTLAARGALGVEQYVGRVVVDDSLFTGAATLAGTGREVSRASAVFRAKGLGAAKGAFHAAATEGVMAVTLNQNGFLYDDSAGTNLAFSALGLGLGAGLGWLGGAYQIRKFVNSDEIRRTFAGALDPELVEESRLLWHGKGIKLAADGATLPGSFLGGTISDRITSLLTNASLLRETKTDLTTEGRELLANRSALATQHLQLAQEEAQKITTKGISSQGRTRFSMNSPGYGNHVQMMMHRDAGSFYGLEQMGGLDDTMTFAGLHDSHMARLGERLEETQARIDELVADGAEHGNELERLQTLVKRIKFEQGLQPLAVMDGEFMTLAEGSAFEGFPALKDIKFTPAEARGKKSPFARSTETDRHGLWEAITENPKGSVSIDSDFIYHLPGKKNLNNADLYDMMRLYKTSQRALDSMTKFTGPLRLPEKPDWFQLDMAEELLRRNPNAQVVFPSGMNRETAQVESIMQKSEALRKWDVAEANLRGKQGDDYETVVSKLRVRYNLPRTTSYERAVTGQVDHPVMALLRGIDAYGPDEVRKMTLQQLQETAAAFKRLGDVAPTTANDMDLFGTSFRFGADEEGKTIKPMLAYKRALDQNEWTLDTVAERIAAGKMEAMQKLTAQDAGPMTRNISANVMASPDLELASRTHELMDNQIQGSIMGKAPQNPFGAASKAVSTSEWRDRDNPIMLAASRIRELINRQVRDAMKVTFERGFGDTLGQLENPRNAASHLLLDQFHSFGSGWDILENPIQREGGFHAFILGDTAENRERFKMMFGRDMAKGQTLLAPSGKEVVLDDLGLAAQQRFNAITDMLAMEKNTLLRAQGRGQIETRRWYVPPPNTKGKYIGFTFGPDGKTVPGMTVVESTPEAFARSKAATEARINDMGMGYTFRTQDQVRDFATIWDRAQMDFIDPGTTAIQPNKRGRGALAGGEIKVNAWKESLQTIRDQYLSHGGDLTEVLFKDQINAAKARSNIAGELTQNKGRLQKNRSIYDMYLENLLGTSKLQSEKSMVGRVYNSLENTIDGFLAAGTPSSSRVWHATTEWINKRVPWDSSQQGRKDFDALSQKLGEYMPFKSAAEMVERQGAGATPPTIAKMAGEINRFSAAVLLRMFEVAHPIMNLTGIVNAMPSVIRHVTPREGEAVADFAARIGHSAQIFDIGGNRALGVIDMSKIGSRAFRRAWSKEAHADYEFMVRNGFLTQEVAEWHRQFGSIETPKGLEQFLYGNPNAKGFNRKGIVGWTDILSSRSEDFSRSWGHMVGLELADTLGIKGREARHAFAHDIANKMIANYSPHNRPEIFQGAMGAPIGLFQSFMQNYYQRIFRYIETGDYRALAQQYAMQAGLFGVTGVPGWQAFQAFWTGQTKGESDPTSSLWQRFGGAADVLGGGVVSNIPKLFGLPAVDLYSRGDTSIRQFGVDLSQSPVQIAESLVPSMNILSKIWQGIGLGIGAFSIDHPDLTMAQLGEVASNMMANRPMAGMIEQFLNGGKDTDRYGQLVNDTKGWAESAYRLIGLRSMRQSRQVEQFYSEKGRQEYQAAAQSQLRLKTRAAIRAGKIDEALPGIAEDYLKSGGDPRYFRRWIKDNYEAATKTRSERMLDSALNNPEKMDQVVRLLDAGVGINADVATPDPQMGYGSSPDDPLNQDLMSDPYPGQMLTNETPGEQ